LRLGFSAPLVRRVEYADTRFGKDGNGAARSLRGRSLRGCEHQHRNNPQPALGDGHLGLLPFGHDHGVARPQRDVLFRPLAVCDVPVIERERFRLPPSTRITEMLLASANSVSPPATAMSCHDGHGRVEGYAPAWRPRRNEHLAAVHLPHTTVTVASVMNSRTRLDAIANWLGVSPRP